MAKSNRKYALLLILSGIGALSLAAVSYFNLFGRETVAPMERAAGPASGQKLGGEWPLLEVGGKTDHLADYQGKVVMLNFWAGWCGPCLEEMPGLYSLYGRFRARGFEVLGMNMDDDPRDGLVALKRSAGNAPFPLFAASSSKLVDHFNITGLPFTVILDRQGVIRYAGAGEVDWAGPQAAKLIESLL